MHAARARGPLIPVRLVRPASLHSALARIMGLFPQMQTSTSNDNVTSTPETDPGALRRALWKNDGALVQVLLKRGYPANFSFAGNFTALHIAAHRGDDVMVAALLEKGADTRQKTGPDGDTPLHLALTPVKGGFNQARLNVVSALLAAGAPANAQNRHKHTPLMLACLHGAPLGVVDALIRKAGPASLNATYKGGITPLHVALGAKPASYEMNKAASENSSRQVVNRLIDAGADVNAPTMLASGNAVFGTTPLGFSLRNQLRDYKALERLILAGADLNFSSKSTVLPLNIAINFGDVDLIQTLLACGADIDIRCKYYNLSPLHLACGLGVHGEDVAVLLIERGANVNILSELGTKPLHHAVGNYLTKLLSGEEILSKPSMKTVSALLAKGANPLEATPDGRLPSEITTDPEIVALLQGHVDRRRRGP